MLLSTQEGGTEIKNERSLNMHTTTKNTGERCPHRECNGKIMKEKVVETRTGLAAVLLGLTKVTTILYCNRCKTVFHSLPNSFE